MITNTVKEFYNIHENMALFFQQNSDKVMGKAGLALNYNFRVLHDALAEFVTARDEIVKKYGTANEEGIIIVDPESENGKKAFEELAEIENAEIDVPMMLINMEDIEKVSEVVAAGYLGIFIWMTKDYQDTLKKD